MSDVSTEKKPFIFDKAKYRQKKYSHENKLNDWKKNHKINAERKYKKMLRKEEKKNHVLQKSNPNLQPLGQKSEENAVKTEGTRKLEKVFVRKLKINDKIIFSI